MERIRKTILIALGLGLWLPPGRAQSASIVLLTLGLAAPASAVGLVVVSNATTFQLDDFVFYFDCEESTPEVQIRTAACPVAIAQ